MSLRQELIEDSRASSYSSNQLNGGQKLDVVDGGIPEWVQRQLELDILLTTALLDGAAYKWQSLSPKTVKVLRRAFFRSLARTMDVAGGEKKRTSRRICECTQRNADRLPPLHVLPEHAGSGLLHVRVFSPPPHVAEHVPHADQAPWTVGQWGWCGW